jgi:hypothetical protein
MRGGARTTRKNSGWTGASTPFLFWSSAPGITHYLFLSTSFATRIITTIDRHGQFLPQCA